jgi:hypothetical protein
MRSKRGRELSFKSKLRGQDNSKLIESKCKRKWKEINRKNSLNFGKLEMKNCKLLSSRKKKKRDRGKNSCRIIIRE